MSYIVNESTSVVQIDSSGLQNGQVNIVYVSTTSIPEQLVSVVDATGYTSSPQAILLSTTGGAQFSDGTHSTQIRQRFGYITLLSAESGINAHKWHIINSASFSNPTVAQSCKSLDTGAVNTYFVNVAGIVSTGAVTTQGFNNSTFVSPGALYTSTLYVNSVSSFLGTRPGDYRMTLAGNEYISGPLLVTGSASYRGSISTSGDLFTIGNISSKLGTIYVGGDVTSGGTIRGQRGNTMVAANLSVTSGAGFVGQTTIASTVSSGDFVNAKTVTGNLSRGTSMNIMSSIIFTTVFQSMRNTPHGIDIIGLDATVPSTVSTSWLTASNSIQTSNLYLESFGPASTLQYLTLGSTSMTNANGSLVTSSVNGNYLVVGDWITVAAASAAQTLTTQGITMNDGASNGTISISFTDGVHIIPNYWVISSVNKNGTLNAPFTSLSTQTVLTHGGSAARLDTVNDTIGIFNTGNLVATDAVYMNGLSNVYFKNVFINNSRGSIMGSLTETIQEIHCSSIVADNISTGTALRFLTPVTAQLQDTFISTVTSGKIHTSSLAVTQITTGFPEYYSTINPSTPWLLTSSFQMNTGADPFMTTTGLGAYFDEATLVANKSHTTYYSIINPLAQQKQYLSTPYINSVAGTGAPGAIVNGELAAHATLGVALSQATTDSGNIFIGSKELGWKIQQINGAAGTISTIAGNYRYFYGDGRYPLNAALGPKLAVSVSPTSRVIITDISNVRLRIITADPIITTIAGTGEASYSGDGDLAYTATFSTPTATATDMSGAIYIADRVNQIIRQIRGSTISTYAGTPGTAGNTGDGGPATAATLNNPFGLAIDLSNNLYFTDLSNCAIRRITASGTIERIAGTYTSGYGGDGGAALSANLSTPRGIALDLSNNIYFCDTGNGRVRRIDAISHAIQTIAGNGIQSYGGDGGLAVNASLSTPTGVATDAAGNVYIADTDNQCIRYVNMNTHKITTVAGRPRQAGYGGDTSFATFALLNSPSHIAVDKNSGYYYIADDGNCRIRYVDPAMRIIYSAAGNGSPLYAGDGGNASDAVFGGIASLQRDSGNNLYVVDDVASMIRVINLSTNIINRVAGTGVPGFTGESGLATLARISSPQTIAFDSNANLYFTDRDNQRVRKITFPAGTISTIAGNGEAGYNGDNLSSIFATLSTPTALAIDRAGFLYVGDLNNNRIRRMGTDPYSILTTYAGSGIYGPPINNNSFASTTLASTTSLAVDSNSQVYFTDATTHGVWKLNSGTNTIQAMNQISTTGAYLGDAGPFSNAYLNTPTGITIDSSGDYVICDQGNSRIRRTYTFGYPQTPVYLTMNLKYTNYFASTGTAYVSLNGNPLATFYGSNMADSNYQLVDANIYSYPLLGSNPVYNDQTPYIEIRQTGTYGYTKLDGTLFVQEVPSQGFLENSANSNSGIIMNSGILTFPNTNNGITIDNHFNDASMRSVLYTGQLLNASDPALKEHIEPADTSMCYSTLSSIPLKRYKYIEPYISTFHVQDIHRLGFLTTDIAPVFPKSVQPVQLEGGDVCSHAVNSLDTAQIKYAHYGVTQHLQAKISTLEAEVEKLARSILAQRNTVL